MAKKNTVAGNAKAVREQESTMEETLNRWEEFFENNKMGIILAVIALILIVVGISLYKSKVVEPRERKVAEYSFAGENYFMAENYDMALNGDGNGFVGFIELADKYSNTKAGKLASAYAGLCLAQKDSCEQAIRYLEKFNGKDQMVGPAVLGALADCYASTDQLDKAAATFAKAAKKADNGLLTPMYLFKEGLIYEALDQPAKAAELYRRIKIEYPGSQEAVTIDQYITRTTTGK